MRLKFNPTNQIFFQKYSNDRMNGIIQISNLTADTIFSFKIKCTNPQLFEVQPLKAVLKPGLMIKVQFTTIDPVNLDFAKQLVNSHKFLIEYVPITSEYAVPNFKNHQLQRKKYYINMDSIRSGSRLFKDNDKISMHSAVSNKMSYISMKNQAPKQQTKSRGIFASKNKFQSSNLQSNNQQMQQKYTNLKQQLQKLQRQRKQIVKNMSKSGASNVINIKKIIVFIIFLVIGSFLGSNIKNYVKTYKQKKQLQHQQMQKQKQNNSWNFFGLFQGFYDEVSPEQV